MLTGDFWRDAFERAVKTAAQFVLVGLGGDVVSVWSLDWKALAGAAGAGFVVSLVTSLASLPFGDADSASVVGSGFDDSLL